MFDWNGQQYTPEEAAELHKALSFYLRVGGAELAKQRTEQQNKSLHLWFRMLAGALNDAGYDIQTVLSQAVERPWTEQAVKELIWRPVQEAYVDKESTTKITKKEIQDIHEILSRHIASKFGVHVPWPQEDMP